MDSREWGRDAAFLKKPVLGAASQRICFLRVQRVWVLERAGVTTNLLPMEKHNSPVRSTGGGRVIE